MNVVVEAEDMAPDASPGEATKRTGVRRVNNVPVYMIGALMAAFLLIMAMVAADRKAKQNLTEDEKHKGGNTSMFAQEIAGDQTGGIIAPLMPPELPKEKEPEPILIARPDNLDLPPAPPSSGQVATAPPVDEEANRIRQLKWQQFEEAVKAKTAVQITSARSSGSPPPMTFAATSSTAPKTRTEMLARISEVQNQINAQPRADLDPTAAYMAQKEMIQSQLNGGSGAANSTPQLVQASSAPTPAAGYANFDNGTTDDRWKMDTKLEAPRSPYEVRAGFVIPATLISGINSDLPGQIMAQVSQNVYDTPTGKHKLIPTGSRLVGAYSSEVKYGQARVLVAWQRIIFPDGKALDIGAMPGADEAGYGGFADLVNNHYLRVFGSAILMSAVTAGITSTQSQQSATSMYGPPNANSVISAALGQQLGQVTAQMIAKNLNISPTLEIRPGYRFNVVVTKDMTFTKPYTHFDY